MEATNILIGKPWKYDREVIHDEVTDNSYFKHLTRSKQESWTILAEIEVILAKLVPLHADFDSNS
ncbi:hypothetical protein CR513_01140, partial [Mucuna pruriens]